MTTLGPMKTTDIKKTSHCTALILAGGRAQRMQQQDKGLISLNGKPMIEHIYSRIEPQVDSLLISCNRNLDQYQHYAERSKLICDVRQGFPGPLAGIEAALSVCTTPLLLVCPCDTPALPLTLRQCLQQALITSTCDIAVAHDGQRQQHLFFMIKTKNTQKISRYLDSGEHRVGPCLGLFDLCRVDFSNEAAAFSNINTPAELKSFNFDTKKAQQS